MCGACGDVYCACCVRVLLQDSLNSFLFFFLSLLFSYERTARPILHKVLRGYNGCVFAFGQTGSGKTYTMQGSGDTGGENSGDTSTGGDGGVGGGDKGGAGGEGGGVITMLCHELFTSIETMVASGKTVDVLAS